VLDGNGASPSSPRIGRLPGKASPLMRVDQDLVKNHQSTATMESLMAYSARRRVVALLILGLPRADAYAINLGPVRSLRSESASVWSMRSAVPPRMESPLFASNWPPPLDAVHCFNVRFGDSDEPSRLAVTPVPEENRAVLALWKFLYAHEAGGGEERIARVQAELRAEMALAAESTIFGAYLSGVDDVAERKQNVDGDENAFALVRYEQDPSVEDEPKVMIIDSVVVSPQMPPHTRSSMQDAVVHCLRAVGAAHGMTVRMWGDYDA
jgi:hypothetical protein